MTAIQPFANRHGFLVFCAITFAIGLPLFGLFPLASPVLQFPLLIVGSYAPALAALITTGISPDPQARPALIARLLRWRALGPWFFFALLIPTITCLGVFLGFDLGRGLAWLSGLAALPVIFLANYGEEAGWRGYALPRLMQDRSAFEASLWLGLVWTIFHAPLYWNRPLEGLLLLGPILPLSVLIAWFFVSTGGSVLVCTLFHATFNTWVLALASPTSTTILFVALTLINAILAVVLWRASGPNLGGDPAIVKPGRPPTSR